MSNRKNCRNNAFMQWSISRRPRAHNAGNPYSGRCGPNAAKRSSKQNVTDAVQASAQDSAAMASNNASGIRAAADAIFDSNDLNKSISMKTLRKAASIKKKKKKSGTPVKKQKTLMRQKPSPLPKPGVKRG